ncbi:hypothetical protein ACULNC_13225 [Shigella flexneri]
MDSYVDQLQAQGEYDHAGERQPQPAGDGCLLKKRRLLLGSMGGPAAVLAQGSIKPGMCSISGTGNGSHLEN